MTQLPSSGNGNLKLYNFLFNFSQAIAFPTFRVSRIINNGKRQVANTDRCYLKSSKSSSLKICAKSRNVLLKYVGCIIYIPTRGKERSWDRIAIELRGIPDLAVTLQIFFQFRVSRTGFSIGYTLRSALAAAVSPRSSFSSRCTIVIDERSSCVCDNCRLRERIQVFQRGSRIGKRGDDSIYPK